MSVEALGAGGYASLPNILGIIPDQQRRSAELASTVEVDYESVDRSARSDIEQVVEAPDAPARLETARTEVTKAYEFGVAPAAEQATPVAAVGDFGVGPGGTVVLPPLTPQIRAPRATGFLDRLKKRAERTAEPRFGVREATEADISTLVDIDMRSFSKVYDGYGKTEAEHRAELTAKFTRRFERLGGKWIPVVTQEAADGSDEIVGFMMSCPTNKDPKDFTSWEETTGDGTLDTLYDEGGKNAYVVTLSMDPKVKGQRGQNLLFAHQIGTFVSEKMDTAFFESRMPGFRNWTANYCRKTSRDIETLSEDEKMALAQEYFGLTRERNGKQVPLDPLLKVYAGAGCNLLKVMPDAYQDEPSMNFGVLCTFENPLKGRLRQSRIMSKVVGGAIKLASKSSWLVRKAFG